MFEGKGRESIVTKGVELDCDSEARETEDVEKDVLCGIERSVVSEVSVGTEGFGGDVGGAGVEGYVASSGAEDVGIDLALMEVGLMADDDGEALVVTPIQIDNQNEG